MSELKPNDHGKITPKPFYNIWFGCSNRKFYQVKEDLYNVARLVGIEIEDGYITEACDYEGDLEQITIYNNERSEALITSVASLYGVSIIDLDDLDIVLSIFKQ